ncbi:daughter of sevenless [Asbolus verrucosus]|uniref:Daughter of sevenless n=1 Tax=Asbolus verrucosus TaxID=1661398 RepID=A0A482VTK4_ASBVE|nr:daughter of sevenless [Asbolus verrucosus]
MAKSGQEVVYEGWLTKSPPMKRIWRAKWRRRWFSLKHSGEIPNQFILTYYTDRNCRKLKGSINLDDCEQVDLGLKIDKRNLKFDHVFDIKTPARTYFLAAESESEMKSWVNCICKVCGLKSTSDEEDIHVSDNTLDNDVDFCEEKDDKHDVPNSNNETPPVSPVSTSPYIPISECITGKTPFLNSQDFKTLLQQNMKNMQPKSNFPQTHTNQTYGISQRNYLNCVNDMSNPRFYDSPRLLSPGQNKQSEETDLKKETNSPLQSPTYSENVFTDDDVRDMNMYVKQKFTKCNMNNKGSTQEKVTAPPRPPKSAHMAPSSYINLNVQPVNNKNDQEDEKKPVLTDDMYDFPRSHQMTESEAVRNMLQKRHCYNNAAPVKIEGQVFLYDISPKPSTSTNQIFTYEVDDIQDEPASPLSQTSSTTAYSNLPSPLLINSQPLPPPIVNRDLKPKRKLSDTLSSSSNPEPSSPRSAPSVDRKLKPPTPLQVYPTLSQTRKTLSVDESKGGRSPNIQHRKHEEEGRKTRGAPSPTLQGLGRSHESLLSQQEEQIYHYLPGKMQYLDLDLDCGPTNISNTNTMPSKSSGANTVYKKGSFVQF